MKGGGAPYGTKSGDVVTMGSIVISVLPSVLPAVISLVQSWTARGQGRIVKFKGPPGELQRLLATLAKGKKKK